MVCSLLRQKFAAVTNEEDECNCVIENKNPGKATDTKRYQTRKLASICVASEKGEPRGSPFSLFR
jgi:hypothetical protein